MIKKIIFSIACLYFFTATADAPGNKAVSDSKVTFKNVSKLTDYVFYWKGKLDSAKFNIDSTFIIPGSRGVPMSALFWGINSKTNESTDSIYFDNYYAPDFIITLDTISNNKLLYSKSQVANSNDNSYYGANSGEGSADPKSSGHTKIILFSVISLIALISLIWYFIRRKNKTLP